MSEQTMYEGELSFADAVAAAAAARSPSPAPSAPENSAPTDLSVQPSTPEAQGSPPNGGESLLKGELDALKAEIAALKAQKAPEREPEAPRQSEVEEVELDFDTHFGVDPAGAIVSMAKKLNVDPKQLAEQLWYEGLGEKAPSDYRAAKEGKRGQLAAKAIEFRQAQERKRNEEAYANREAEEVQTRYIGTLRSFVAETPAEKLPNTSKLFAENPDMVIRGMWSHAASLAAQGNDIPSPEQVAASLEKELQTLAKVFGHAPAPVQPPVATPPAPAEPPATLRNQFSQVQPSRAQDDELDDEVLRQRAMKALEDQRRREGLL